MKNSDPQKKPSYLDSRERLEDLDEAFSDYANPTTKLSRTFDATYAKVLAKVDQMDIVEVYLDRLTLHSFLMASGRINRRAVARELLRALEDRNKKLEGLGIDQKLIRVPGLRTMENLVQHFLDHPDEK
jgi:hypothetical protein